MLEALVDKRTGVVVLARDPGLPWGKKEGRDRDSMFFVVRLHDDDLERRHNPGTVTSFPYAEYENVEVDDGDGGISIDRRMVRYGTKLIPSQLVNEPVLSFRQDRTLGISSLVHDTDLEEVKIDAGTTEIGSG